MLKRQVNKRLTIFVFCLLLPLVFPTLLFAWEGKVVGVTDGDTIKVIKDDRQIKVRLAAIDTPEKGQPYGQAAKKFTADLVAGKVVKVWPTDTDRYGRTIAFVFVGGTDVNKELLKAGLAWHYKQYSRDPELAKLEFEARSAKRGLWSEADPVPPWEWRRGKRSGASTNVQNVSTDPNAPLHGNTKSKVFHRKGCRYYNCKNCTVRFSSSENAVNEGFKPCGICKP
jgi:micrococcal nuclease